MEDRFLIYPVDPQRPESLPEIFVDRLVFKSLGSASPRYEPLQSTINHLQRLNPLCVVVQRNVQDPDFLAEHAAYYANWPYKVPRFCDRLHFFSRSAISDDPLETIDDFAENEGCYLGFATLRPISLSPLAATVLKTQGDNDQRFVLANDEFVVHLAGRNFSIIGTPFMQQDNAVGACAQASIWMAFRTLRRKEGQVAHSPAEITSAATRFLVTGRTLPNRRGLIVEQVAEAIRSAGYSPHMIPLRHFNQQATQATLDNALIALYPYVESGIPVLLLLFPANSEGHAVLLIGHNWNDPPAKLLPFGSFQHPDWNTPITISDAASWIDPFIVHNDNSGPYLDLPAQGAPYSLETAVSAIPFFPSDVYMDGAEARLTAQNLLKAVVTEANAQEPALQDLVARTYLQDRSDFRAATFSSDMPSDVKGYYRMKWLPKRIWVTELNTLDNYANAPNGADNRIGEILVDPASEPEDAHFLSVHLGPELLPGHSGIVIDRDALLARLLPFQSKAERTHLLFVLNTRPSLASRFFL